MAEANTDQLKRVIESQHSGTATFTQSVCVLTKKNAGSDWDGMVHVFDLKNHPNAKKAYAWSSPVSGSTQPRFFAVLHMGRINGPIEAVKAAAAAIRKWGPRGT